MPQTHRLPVLHRAAVLLALLLALLCASGAQEALQVLDAVVDRPTLHVLGVQVLIAGDADRDARIDVRYRESGAQSWRAGLPLLRVWPEVVAIPVPEQFAGSVFDLQPGTTYQIELRARDPDGGEWTQTLTATTRTVPRAEPAQPRRVDVTTVRELQSALARARPGDVIGLAEGAYAGRFELPGSGQPDNPIVVRGASAAGVVLDGQGCTGCNVLEVAGSWVHVEDLTLTHAERGLRFTGARATGNVARRLRVTDVVHGIGKASDQTDFYLADNLVAGRLAWPWVFAADATSHWDDRGIDVAGDGHVICHNRIAGFGDPIVNKKVGARGWDVYGNDIADSFDGTELDESAGNVRLFRNRWTNVMAPISIQPMHGGPAYVLRNVLYNIPDEQIKLKSLGGEQLPSGVLVYHNTFVSPDLALNLQSPITQYHFEIANNLFVGPETLESGRTVDWTTQVVNGVFDYNGYWPDGSFWFGSVEGRNRFGTSFAEVQAAGEVEAHGRLLQRGIFAAGFVGPAEARVRHEPPPFALASGSDALDAGLRLPGVNDGFAGAGPDLGALEAGCPEPQYGPRSRADADAGRIWPVDCGARSPTGVLDLTGVGSAALLAAPRLYASAPNPFNASTTIRFEVPAAGPLDLAVYDVLGRPVRTLVHALRHGQGEYTAAWDGRDGLGRRVSTGVYVCRLEAMGRTLCRRMVVVR
ncbi:MAG: chondroitinase-B domain-containing protein [Candidatus Latescibacterota bacterium]